MTLQTMSVQRHRQSGAGDTERVFEERLPLGMQIVGRAFDEATVLRVGAGPTRRLRTGCPPAARARTADRGVTAESLFGAGSA